MGVSNGDGHGDGDGWLNVFIGVPKGAAHVMPKTEQ